MIIIKWNDLCLFENDLQGREDWRKTKFQTLSEYLLLIKQSP